jgi:hypothetical protein
VGGVAKCIGCGCDDLHACRPGGCCWLRVDRELKVGVCSNCEDFLVAWDAGVRVLKYKPASTASWGAFQNKWCKGCNWLRCSHSCVIASRAMLYSPNELKFPIEWQLDHRGLPICTSFDAAEPIPILQLAAGSHR